MQLIDLPQVLSRFPTGKACSEGSLANISLFCMAIGFEQRSITAFDHFLEEADPDAVVVAIRYPEPSDQEKLAWEQVVARCLAEQIQLKEVDSRSIERSGLRELVAAASPGGVCFDISTMSSAVLLKALDRQVLDLVARLIIVETPPRIWRSDPGAASEGLITVDVHNDRSFVGPDGRADHVICLPGESVLRCHTALEWISPLSTLEQGAIMDLIVTSAWESRLKPIYRAAESPLGEMEPILVSDEPRQVFETILAEASARYSEERTSVVCLGARSQVLAAGLAALSPYDLRLVTAVPDKYAKDGYSEGSSTPVVHDFADFELFRDRVASFGSIMESDPRDA